MSKNILEYISSNQKREKELHAESQDLILSTGNHMLSVTNGNTRLLC